jgi:hypothetical protein
MSSDQKRGSFGSSAKGGRREQQRTDTTDSSWAGSLGSDLESIFDWQTGFRKRSTKHLRDYSNAFFPPSLLFLQPHPSQSANKQPLAVRVFFEKLELVP